MKIDDLHEGQTVRINVEGVVYHVHSNGRADVSWQLKGEDNALLRPSNSVDVRVLDLIPDEDERIEGLINGEEILQMVYDGLAAAGVVGQRAIDAVNQMQNEGVIFRGKYDIEDEIISKGERWEIVDLLDESTMVSFDSWNCFDPERRARELFVTYPRDAKLVRTRVVKYQPSLVETNYSRTEELDIEGEKNDE